MSQNKHWRESWIKVIYARAVTLFHQERKLPENADEPFADLARQCANTVFADAANAIVGDKEVCAKEFLAHCRENFAKEIAIAIGKRAQQEMAANQEEYVA